MTDLHYGEKYLKDVNSSRVVRDLIDYEKPDLAVLTGDMVSGFAWDGKPGWYEKQWKNWTKPFEEKQQIYMYILGNHDPQADLDRDQVTALDMTLNYSITEQGPNNINGSTNYVKAVYDKTGTKRLFYLWAFDSMSDNCQKVKGWGCVYPSQVEWYREMSKKIVAEDNGEVLPGFAFFHIPLPETLEMYNSFNIYGIPGEKVCCFSVNTGLYSAFKEMGSIKDVFCGHDHDNDFWGNYYGINLYYGRKTGYGCYGPLKGVEHGARVLEFSYSEATGVTLKNWIREEYGHVKKSQDLFPSIFKTMQMYCKDMHPEEQKYLDFFKAKREKYLKTKNE